MSRIEARFSGTVGDLRLDVAFKAPKRGVTALFGPSGCGKTTVLRCVAGLTRLAQGYLSVDGVVWQDGDRFVPPHRRPLAYVFQEASLFAHLSVRGNLDYGRRRRRPPGPSFEEVVELLGLRRLLDRAPARLSGGERQRVAIGRALLSGPELLLMDEPLAALDRLSKDEIIPYLETLHDTLSVPVIYVSHDIDEVLRLADHMVLLQDGRLQAAGSVEALLTDSRLPMARSAGAVSVLTARIRSFDADDGLTTVEIDGGRLRIPGRIGAPGSHHRVRVAANDVSLAPDPPSPTTILNILQARIEHIEPVNGAQVNIGLCVGAGADGARLLARITKHSLTTFGFRIGQQVYAQVKSVSMVDPRRGR